MKILFAEDERMSRLLLEGTLRGWAMVADMADRQRA
jgi:hypothetical protein